MNEKPGITAALREAATLIARLPADLPAPYVTAGSWGYAEVSWMLQLDTKNQDEQKRLASGLVRAVGGRWDKVPGDTFRLERAISGLRLKVSVDREAVCERVVTGTETVTIPEVAAQPERTETREVVEWRCEPLLAETPRDAVTA